MKSTSYALTLVFVILTLMNSAYILQASPVTWWKRGFNAWVLFTVDHPRNPKEFDKTTLRLTCQGVSSGILGSYTNNFQARFIQKNLDNTYQTANWCNGFKLKWNIPASIGTLTPIGTNGTSVVLSSTHTPPATAPKINPTPLYCQLFDPKGIYTGLKQVRNYYIYNSHLERDVVNFPSKIVCANIGVRVIPDPAGCTAGHKVEPESQGSFTYAQPISGEAISIATPWNCHGSVWHAYNNSGTMFNNNTVAWPDKQLFNPQSPTLWNDIAKFGLKRGDVIAYYSSGGLEHSHTCITPNADPSRAIMWGANNRPGFQTVSANCPMCLTPFSMEIALWQFDQCTPKQYLDALIANRDVTEVRVSHKP